MQEFVFVAVNCERIHIN